MSSERHHHVADPYLSVPSSKTCRCGAILPSSRTEWIDSIWDPGAVSLRNPPEPEPRPVDRHRTTPLPLVLADILTEACR